jgi:LEA14-like dessication related protein
MRNLLLLGGAGAALLFFLRQKKAAGENLRVEPVDVAIDTARSAQSFYTRIYYRVKLKLINVERASVNVSGINLNVSVNNNPFGSIVSADPFIVSPNSEKIINLDASIASLGVINLVRDLISEGLNLNVNVSGYIDTDLGRITVNFSKNLGANNISGYEYKVTDCMDSRDCDIEIQALLNSKPYFNFTAAEKKRYFRLQKRRDKFIKQGK